MKFNFKKIASIVATTIMLGSTIAFAAAAYPAPFVNSGVGDAAIVVGANAAATDTIAATDLGASLDESITSASGSTTATEGDKIKLQKSTNLFNLGENMSEFYSTLDNEQLTKVLADGVYTNDANDEYDFEQSITLGTQLQLTHFLDSDFNNDKPIIGFDLADGTHILNYTLEFTPDAVLGGTLSSTKHIPNLETTDLTMLGRSYYIVKAEENSNGVKLTLLDNANTATATYGDEPMAVTVGDKTYQVSVDFIDATNTILVVDGVKTNKMVEGDVFKVGTDSYVAVKNILYDAKESGISKVEFSIGSGKIVMENGQEVQVNGKDISDITDPGQILNAYITNSSTDVSKIVLEWNLDDDDWIAPGTELVLPGFETIKFSMTGFNQPGAESSKFEADGDTKYVLKTTIKDGSLTLPLLYMNDSITGVGGMGEKVTHQLRTFNETGRSGSTSVGTSLNESQNNYFVATWISGKDFETYAYELSGIRDASGKNETTLKNLAGGSDIVFSEVGKDKDRGNINFKLDAASDDDKIANITVSVTSGLVYLDRLVTKEGLQIRLPVTGQKDMPIGNYSVGDTTWTTNLTEEDKDGNVAYGKSFTITSTVNSNDGMEPTATGSDLVSTTALLETEDDSNNYIGYVQSPIATKVLWYKPTSGANTLDIIYPGGESSADVYISEAAVKFTGSNAIAVVKDTEVDSVKDKNLVVVGGSCINTVAAQILGSSTPLCGSAFSDKTGAGVGKYLIQVAASPVNSGKIAMLVAGYEAPDTVNAVAFVKQGTVDTSKNGATVYPVATA